MIAARAARVARDSIAAAAPHVKERRRPGGWPGGVLAAAAERRRGTPAGQPARTPAFHSAAHAIPLTF
jgi:hypothetical protein